MTTDTRTEAEKRYDAERDGTLYTTPVNPEPAHLLALRAQIDAETDPDMRKRLICRMVDQVLGLTDDAPEADGLPAEVASGEMSLLQYAARWIDQHLPTPQPTEDVLIGHIDGCPVLASYSDETGKLYAAELTWHDLKVSTDGRSYINLPSSDDDPNCGCVGDVSLMDWQRIRALIQSGVIDQLVALAQAHQTYPPPAATSKVRVTHNWHDTDEDGDLCNEPRGPLAYTNFLCGSKEDDSICEISFPVAKHERPAVYMFGRDELDLNVVERTLDSLLTLLADPCVQAMRKVAA